MAKNTIIWSETALSQRIEIFEYWNLRNGNTKYSTKLLYKIKGRIKVDNRQDPDKLLEILQNIKTT